MRKGSERIKSIGETDIPTWFNLSKKTNERPDLRKVFMDQYGVTIEFPAYYHKTAKFVPPKCQYIVTAAFHIVPTRSNQMV